VPVDHLLARLEVDSSAVGRRIVKLLFNSYMPVDKPLELQLSRAIQLVRSNHAAARKFYLHAYLYLSVFPTGEFAATFLWLTMIGHVEKSAEYFVTSRVTAYLEMSGILTPVGGNVRKVSGGNLVKEKWRKTLFLVAYLHPYGYLVFMLLSL